MSRSKSVALTLEVSGPVYQMLKHLVRSGFYGTTPEAAAERVLCQALDQRQRDSLLDVPMPCLADPDGQHFPGCGCEQ